MRSGDLGRALFLSIKIGIAQGEQALVKSLGSAFKKIGPSIVNVLEGFDLKFSAVADRFGAKLRRAVAGALPDVIGFREAKQQLTRDASAYDKRAADSTRKSDKKFASFSDFDVTNEQIAKDKAELAALEKKGMAGDVLRALESVKAARSKRPAPTLPQRSTAPALNNASPANLPAAPLFDFDLGSPLATEGGDESAGEPKSRRIRSSPLADWRRGLSTGGLRTGGLGIGGLQSASRALGGIGRAGVSAASREVSRSSQEDRSLQRLVGFTGQILELMKRKPSAETGNAGVF
jgi:hypothetical protein